MDEVRWLPGQKFQFVPFAPYQAVAIYSPIPHLAFFGGVGCGKSFSLAHFVIQQILDWPDLTGFVGANTYDQMSMATLKELFYWLDHYHLEWVIDRQPPVEWGGKRKKFKKYNNILSVKHPGTGKAVYVFTRVLSAPNALRGFEVSWYAIDETRDTPQETHDVLLGRCRESSHIRGRVFTTTNGQDWAWQRFVKGNDGSLYGCMHIPTAEAVRLGILTQEYLDTMRKSYSPMFALQELDAKHVNVYAGRAYYAAGEVNKKRRAPWGDFFPNPDRPLIIGCDFNFSPAPHTWVVGQLGPGPWHQHIHWFRELSFLEAGTRSMAQTLMGQYPGFFYRVFGDASGGKGTTSNAGEHDYAQMAQEFAAGGVQFTIDYDQANPRVRDRVENVNARLLNSMGQTHMTYNPDTCPNLDQDFAMVGWKPTVKNGMGKLDDGGDVQRTHAADAAGYATWKVLPPHRQGAIIGGVPSQVASSFSRR